MDLSAAPEDIRPLFAALRNDLIGIHFRWATWKRLFRTDEGTRELLQWGAGQFFDGVYRVYLSDVCLGICRLLDAQGSGQRQNLVIERLVDALNEAGRPELTVQMRPLIDDAKKNASSLFTWRNKYYAHRDLKHAFDEELAKDATLVFSEIDTTLALLADCLNVVELAYTVGTTFYADPIDPGPDQLLGKIRDAKRWRSLPAEFRWQHRRDEA